MESRRGGPVTRCYIIGRIRPTAITTLPMPYLLDNRLAPITSSWSFLEAPLDDVVRSYARWQRMILHRVRVTRLELGLEDALRRLEPLDLACSRVLFQSTRSGWTAVFGNSAIGNRPPVVAYLSERMGRRGLDCVAIPNMRKRGQPRGMWGSVELTLYAASRTGANNRERSIRVSNDVRGWEFYSAGTPQPFEEPSQYAQSRTADRFTTEMLERYARSLGLEVFNPAFYCGPGFLTRSAPWFFGAPRPMTLAEARERLGFSAD
jgi:hypothetical protein